jgi:hypothetical protein
VSTTAPNRDERRRAGAARPCPLYRWAVGSR